MLALDTFLTGDLKIKIYMKATKIHEVGKIYVYMKNLKRKKGKLNGLSNLFDSKDALLFILGFLNVKYSLL